MKHKKTFTRPALLAGLWVWLSMIEVMDSYSPDELRRLRNTAHEFLRE